MSQTSLFGEFIGGALAEMAENNRRAREEPLENDLLMYCKLSRVPWLLPDTIEAGDSWGANCGPMSLAAVLGLPSVEAARPLVQPFRGFMSPTAMQDALTTAKRAYTLRSLERGAKDPWPEFGLVRIQWDGPWCGEGVNPQAAYRYTHWVGVRRGLPKGDERLDWHDDRAVMIYDATPNRWIPLARWEAWAPTLYPKRATGHFPVTAISVIRPRGRSK